MIADYRKMLEARNWMKRNEMFLPTWHAYVGYRLDLFNKLWNGETIDSLASDYGYEKNLLQSWADAGIVLGHLKQRGGRLVPSRKMMTYFTRQSSQSVGELLKEMMEMHMPTLMHYPEMIETSQKGRFDSDQFSTTVAATSALIEKRAFGPVLTEMTAQNPRWVLDIGCGTGGYLMKLSKRFKKGTFVGVDISKACIEEARLKAKEQGINGKVKFYYADINTWDVPNGLFQVVMMNNLFHYYSPDSRENLLERVAELLDEGGSLIVVTPLYMEKGGEPFSAVFNSFMQGHENLYTLPRKEELVRDAAEAGLELKSIKTVVKEGSWYCISFRKKTV